MSGGTIPRQKKWYDNLPIYDQSLNNAEFGIFTGELNGFVNVVFYIAWSESDQKYLVSLAGSASGHLYVYDEYEGLKDLQYQGSLIFTSLMIQKAGLDNTLYTSSAKINEDLSYRDVRWKIEPAEP